MAKKKRRINLNPGQWVIVKLDTDAAKTLNRKIIIGKVESWMTPNRISPRMSGSVLVFTNWNEKVWFLRERVKKIEVAPGFEKDKKAWKALEILLSSK